MTCKHPSIEEVRGKSGTLHGYWCPACGQDWRALVCEVCRVEQPAPDLRARKYCPAGECARKARNARARVRRKRSRW